MLLTINSYNKRKIQNKAIYLSKKTQMRYSVHNLPFKILSPTRTVNDVKYAISITCNVFNVYGNQYNYMSEFISCYSDVHKDADKVWILVAD